MAKAKAKAKATAKAKAKARRHGCYNDDYLLYIAYRLPIDCLLIALDAHMFSHDGYGPGSIGNP